MKIFNANNIKLEKADGKGMIDGNAMIKYLLKAKLLFVKLIYKKDLVLDFFVKFLTQKIIIILSLFW